MSKTSPGRRRSGVRRRSAEVLSAVRPLAESIAAARDLVVWDLGFRREAGRDTLTVSVDRRGGIGSGEIASFAEELSRALDAGDVVPGDERYLLEVASPGAERKLSGADQFRLCEGRPVRITFRDSRPPLEGVIHRVDEGSVLVEHEGGSESVAFDDMSQARLSLARA